MTVNDEVRRERERTVSRTKSHLSITLDSTGIGDGNEAEEEYR